MCAINSSTEDKGAALAAAARAQADLVRSWPKTEACNRISVVETHISYVVLAGRFAYKIKKAVNLGFLDFSSLEKRHYFCAEEIRLNRRLAAEIYLEVVPITGTPLAPGIGGEGEIIEYAVKMRRFAQSALLDRCLARDRVPAEMIDSLADRIAAFHELAERCPAGTEYGSPSVVCEAMTENFRQLRGCLPPGGHGHGLNVVERWSEARRAELNDMIAARQRAGLVRECHGDLHLGNIALVRGRPLIFDCIEFNPELRWIDVVNEVAFMVMDLEERGRPDYGYRFLDRYLERSGDYAGLGLLAFYQVYRALVRAKVAAIRAGQEEGAARRREMKVCDQYLAYAHRTTAARQRFLVLMHGVSGAGKSWVSQVLLETTGAVRLRSDVERKRLVGLPALAPSRSQIGGGLYGEAMTEATYARLAELAQSVLAAGCPVIVDAASLKAWQRATFRRLAGELGVPFLLVACTAPEAVLRQRLSVRERAATDASEADAAVLEQQLRSLEPLAQAERQAYVAIDTAGLAREELKERLFAALKALP